MHMLVQHPKKVLDSSNVTALDSFDLPFKLHELTDSRKVVASSEAVLADFRTQMLDRIRLRPDSVILMHGVGQPIFNPVFVQVSLWTCRFFI